jgi:nicotinamide-nucleotide amidase
MENQGQTDYDFPMKAGFLIIASEVLNGKITDVNNQALARFLRPFSIEIEKTLIVKDDTVAIHKALKGLLEDCDFVVTSGGLGPTKDDLTKEALGSFFGKKLLFSETAMAIAEKNYEKFGRPYPGKDHGYSFLPEGFIALNNPMGFAPALFFEENGKAILCGPGVPREFRGILEEHFEKLILSRRSSEILFRLVNIRTKRIPEEKIFGEVDTTLWDQLESFGDVSSLPNYLGVDVGVKITGTSSEELDRKEKEIISIIDKSPLKPAVWHVGLESIEEIILSKARELNLRFGFAESATGGLCAHRITSVSGSSASFMGSIVSYDNSVKESALGVKASTLEKYSELSVEAAKEMAQGARERLRVDVAVSVSGIAGPGGGTPEKPVGFVCIGVSSKLGTEGFEAKLFGDREQLKFRFSQQVLMTLIETMEKIAGS